MAAGDIIQNKKNNTGVSTALSITVTLDSTPTEGNLLIACHFTGDGNSSAEVGSGFSEAVAMYDGTRDDEGAIYYKVAGSSESTAVTCESDVSEEHALIVLEVEGPWAASPLDQTATYPRADYDTTPETGTTGTTSQADEFAVALITNRDSSANNASSWTNSFVERNEEASQFKGEYVATRVLSATGTYSSGCTLSTAGNGVMGGIATFKFAASGLSIPVAMHHRQMQGMS